MPDASYLVFLDCRELNLSQKELVEFLWTARAWLSTTVPSSARKGKASCA